VAISKKLKAKSRPLLAKKIPYLFAFPDIMTKFAIGKMSI
jgi:hypothetical protein